MIHLLNNIAKACHHNTWLHLQISLIVNAASMGMFLGNVMGPYLSMEMFCYVSIVPNILFMVLFSLIPESPYHYALHGNIDEAEASLKWFQRETNVKTEIQELQDFVDGANTSILTKLKDFLLPGIWKHRRENKVNHLWSYLQHEFFFIFEIFSINMSFYSKVIIKYFRMGHYAANNYK